jgi:ABC-2 type transport system ATP-binding protein
MDEAEYCDRIAIMDQGRIIVLDTPEALKAKVGHDRVQIQTDDDAAAIVALRERFQIEATVAEGEVTFGVPAGEHFVPRLFDEWDPAHPPIRAVRVSRPSLDDVFMSYTGTTIRDAEDSQIDTRRNFARMMSR